MINRQCLSCEGDITDRALRALFCSSRCSNKYYRHHKESIRVEKNCAFCGGVFLRTRITQVCCSKRCVNQEWKKHNVTAESRRQASLMYNYGLTVEEWKSLFESQGNCCAICKTDNPGPKKEWATDHDHETGKVRGILCTNCNLGLGYFKDNLGNLNESMIYLLQHKNLAKEFYN